jgi:hypothetical protein
MPCAGVVPCATADTGTASAAAIEHDAATDTNEARNQRGETSGNCDEPRDEPGSKPDVSEETRRLRDKEIGNVVEGQRNMAEILTPPG